MYWSTDGQKFHHAQDINYLLALEQQEIEACNAQLALVAANVSAVEFFLDVRRKLSRDFTKYGDAFTTTHQRANFKTMLLKVFLGEQWEQKVLRALLLD